MWHACHVINCQLLLPRDVWPQLWPKIVSQLFALEQREKTFLWNKKVTADHPFQEPCKNRSLTHLQWKWSRGILGGLTSVHWPDLGLRNCIMCSQMTFRTNNTALYNSNALASSRYINKIQVATGKCMFILNYNTVPGGVLCSLKIVAGNVLFSTQI